jgi:hypothetical protein
MKLKEFLEVAVLSKNNTLNLINPTFVDETCLYGEELDKYKNIIKECDEFAKCDSLDILTMPLVKGKKDKIYTTETIKLSDLMEFKGRCYLLSLGLTPEMYDPTQLIKPVKNGAAMGPTMYDPLTFEPRKHILLTWSPEMAQDVSGTNDELTLRNDIHKLLDDVLDNPEEYKTKGTRQVLVRGLFEVVDKYDGSEVVTNHYDVDLTANKPDDVGYTVYYLEQNVVKPGEINLELKHKVIPSHLKDKFIDEVGTDPKLITEELIDNFLENQGINRYTGRLAEILKKGKEVEDKIAKVEEYHKAKVEEYHKAVKKIMKLKKESEK